MPAKRKEDATTNDDAESLNSSSNSSVRDSTKRPKLPTNKTAAVETIKNPVRSLN